MSGGDSFRGVGRKVWNNGAVAGRTVWGLGVDGPAVKGFDGRSFCGAGRKGAKVGTNGAARRAGGGIGGEEGPVWGDDESDGVSCFGVGVNGAKRNLEEGGGRDMVGGMSPLEAEVGVPKVEVSEGSSPKGYRAGTAGSFGEKFGANGGALPRRGLIGADRGPFGAGAAAVDTVSAPRAI